MKNYLIIALTVLLQLVSIQLSSAQKADPTNPIAAQLGEAYRTPLLNPHSVLLIERVKVKYEETN